MLEFTVQLTVGTTLLVIRIEGPIPKASASRLYCGSCDVETRAAGPRLRSQLRSRHLVCVTHYGRGEYRATPFVENLASAAQRRAQLAA